MIEVVAACVWCGGEMDIEVEVKGLAGVDLGAFGM
jgi:hypothetical protein